MSLKIVSPRKALNLSFLKVKPLREEIESFKINLTHLLDQIDEAESEEFHKNIISKFLYATYYTPNFYINTKGRNDLVIHNGKDARSSVGVIIETKKPTNKGEMLRVDNINTKAFQELVLYYLRERVTGKNLEIRHLVVTNIYEWFVFDVDIFEKAFGQDSDFIKQFVDFEEKRLSGKTTDFFYKEIAEPAIKRMLSGDSRLGKEISYAYFDIRDYERILRNEKKDDDAKLIALFKLLSPEHLLKLPFKNDSNSLDKGFYSELLHIIGLAEFKKGSKKLIDRKEEGKRDSGSLIEKVISQLDSLDKISRLDKPSQYGSTKDERLFNLGLELVITWINRILFLKLLEAQLVTYHKGDKSYSFLNSQRIKNFDDLNRLFFQVLARQKDERNTAIRQMFEKVPYLNSSLFEPTDIEHSCIFISQLEDDQQLPILPSTVLRDMRGKRRTGELSTLEYIFHFLDAYDFSSEGSEEIQEDNKTLISASVLGLIFEKINGYKDGSFFTPGFITMYMCRETIRRAVVQKFKEVKGWNCSSITELFDFIKDKKEANEIINSIKICDPAVGSGHFLVSALNEIIAVKSELKILLDRQGQTLRDYEVEVHNDELVITDNDANLFEYNPNSKESQKIQEALFHEKQNIIENCLFGVDINQNSVKICRLRLWIELLKNAYYRVWENHTELETLPNIDINIKCGNSLISRFGLDVDLSQALKKSSISVKGYKMAVQNYRHALSKEKKREMEVLIATIKTSFRSEISNNDPLVKKLSSKKDELRKLVNQTELFELSRLAENMRRIQKEKLKKEILLLTSEIEEIKNNKIFENAFEWRFEFPEVLDDNGDFQGFDVVLGNPPYGVKEKGAKYLEFVQKYYPIARRTPDSYFLFIVKGRQLARNLGIVNYIVPNTFCDIEQGNIFRNWLLVENNLFKLYDSSWAFEDAIVDTVVFFLDKSVRTSENLIITSNNYVETLVDYSTFLNNPGYKIDFRADQSKKSLLNKMQHGSVSLGSISTTKAGVKLYEVGKGVPPQSKEVVETKPFTSINTQPAGWRPLVRGGDINKYRLNRKNEFVNYGPWLAAPREEEMFKGIRIVIRRTDDVLRATILEDDSVCVNSCHVLIPDNPDHIYAILAILNSKLAQWVFEIQNPQMVGKTFAEIKVVYIENLPIKLPNDLSRFDLIVRSILISNEAQIVTDFSRVENEIDSLVYELYDLSKEEIAVVERSEPKE